MLSRIVIAKLRESRRLVMPDLGVFVMREDGRILFSELMRSDDGVLRSAVEAERGVGEVEASRNVERFVADIRHSLDHGMSYRLEGLGVLVRDDRGLVIFKSREEENLRRSPARGAIARILAESAAELPETDKIATSADEPETLAEEPQPETVEPKAETPEQEQESEPEPVPGAVVELMPESGSENVRKPQRRSKSGGVDIFIIVAVVIAVVAIAAIAYGVWVANSIDDGAIQVPTEQPAISGDSEEVDLSIPSGM